MGNLIRAEARKLVTTRTFAIVAAAVVALSALGVAALSLAGGDAGPDLATNAGVQQQVLSAANAVPLAMVVGVLIVCSEHRHGTIVPTVLAESRRWPTLAAKAVVAAVAAVALTAVMGAVTLAAGVVAIDTQDGELLLGADQLARTWALQGLLAAGLALVALGVGAAVRHQTVALVVVLVAAMVAAPIVSAAAPDVSWYLIPDNLSRALVHASAEAPAPAGMPVPTDPPFGRWTATAILGGYAAAALTAGIALLTRRDLA